MVDMPKQVPKPGIGAKLRGFDGGNLHPQDGGDLRAGQSGQPQLDDLALPLGQSRHGDDEFLPTFAGECVFLR